MLSVKSMYLKWRDTTLTPGFINYDKSDIPFSIGFDYGINDNFNLGLSFERGNIFSLKFNYKRGSENKSSYRYKKLEQKQDIEQNKIAKP